MNDIPVMLLLAFFFAGGAFMTMAACFTGQTVWPLVPLLLAAAALLPICGFDLLSMDNDMPAALQDDDKGLGRGDFGWFLCGIWLTFAWSCPLVLARHSVLSMRISWFTSIGTWGLIGTVAGLLVFFIKGRSSSDSSVWL